MEVVEEAGPDSTDSSGRWVAVHVAPKTKLPRGVPLKEMKADPALAAMKMLRQGRLSVAPLTKAAYENILAMAERTGSKFTSGRARPVPDRPPFRPDTRLVGKECGGMCRPRRGYCSANTTTT